jgi:uncharacterized protein GlcG (DUF336 family)
MKMITKKELSLDACMSLGEAAISKANEIGLHIAVTIVDSGGNVKIFLRMDGAPLMATEVSRKKALTAVGFGLSTGAAWHDFVKNDPILDKGVNHIPDFIMLGGGKPIIVDGELLGAIGVSGGHYAQDEACCDAALATI